MTVPNFTLSRDAYGQLVLTSRNGERHTGIVPVRAIPIGAQTTAKRIPHKLRVIGCIARA